ncbi:unnamed protein product [Discula destructiva]
MKFSAALLLAPLVAAMPSRHYIRTVNGTMPSTYANVDITEFTVRETLAGNTLQVTGIESVSFVINGDLVCSASPPSAAGYASSCEDPSSPFSFELLNSTMPSAFGLKIYKATSAFNGMYGTGDITTACRSGGGSIQICDQVSENTIVIGY